MIGQKIGSTVAKGVINTANDLAKFAKLERNLAAVCMFIPLLLIVFDSGPVRNSISAYYDMTEAQFFYVPLTMAAMLFIVNGVVKDKQRYNTILGVALMAVVLFNHDDLPIPHFIGAGIFFLGNAYVILKYSSKEELWFKKFLVAIIVVALASWGLKWITLFWAEWVSLGIIAIHYILESMGAVD